MYSLENVKLHLRLQQFGDDGKKVAGHVALVIRKACFWKMLGMLSKSIDSYLRNKETKEIFFGKLVLSLEDPCFEDAFDWSDTGDGTDIWILVRDTPTSMKVYCRNNESQKWDEATVNDDEIGILPNYKLLQCTLADYLVDDELWQGMSDNDHLDYIKSIKTLDERMLF